MASLSRNSLGENTPPWGTLEDKPTKGRVWLLTVGSSILLSEDDFPLPALCEHADRTEQGTGSYVLGDGS